jgi:uncharacterized protein
MLEITQMCHTKNPDPVFPALYQMRDFGEVFIMASKSCGTCICQGTRTHYKIGEYRHDLNVAVMAFYNGVLTLKQSGHLNDTDGVSQVIKVPEETKPPVVDKKETKTVEETIPQKECDIMSDTYKKLKADIIVAMKAKDARKLEILRGLDGAIQLKAKNDLVPIDEGIVIDVLGKGVKQRNESITEYTKGNRPELAAKEQEEMDIYKSYLPAQLTKEEIEVIVDAAIAEVDAKSIKDMGAVNKIVMPKIKGQADGKVVSELVKQKIALRASA